MESRCNFRNSNFSCGASYYHGYMHSRGVKIFHDDALKEEVLMTSSQTGFTIEYLIELVNDVQISATTFEAAAKKFDKFHKRNLPFDVKENRVELNRKRISECSSKW